MHSQLAIEDTIVADSTYVSTRSQQHRYVTLDGMRGIAALSVAAHHFGGGLISGGYLAVDFFFLLSGFVLMRTYGSWLQGGGHQIEFARIRVIRLFPIYIIGLLFGACYTVFGILRHWQASISWFELTTSVFFNLFMLPAPFSPALFPTNMPAWSLFYEMLAGLALPALLVRRSNMAILAFCAVAAIAITLVGYRLVGSPDALGLDHSPLIRGPTWEVWYLGLMRMAFSFPLGVVIARLTLSQGRRISNWVVLLIVLLASIFAISVSGMARLWYDLICIFAIFPVILIFASRIEPKGVVAKIARFGGNISFALYAVHATLCRLAWYYLEQRFAITAGISLLIYLAASIALAWSIATWIDPPVRRRLSNLFADKAEQGSSTHRVSSCRLSN
ncbi:acyltransferase [Novosphingobium sp.]|uniref:acyltransferase family protein n=1 Tax=Novosphingobium sp. TaxID=1874826 RepID=UPI0025E1306C|nr:acyltransferase [Novosphingobium sp.]